MGNNFNSIKLGTSQFDFRPYTTCGTAAATAAKTVSVANFSLFNGASVTVKFTYANTAASPTLNVNSTGDKLIYYNGAELPSAQYWAAGSVIEFIYDGTSWNVNGAIKDNNTNTKVTSAANHYTPSADSGSELTASLSGTAGSYAKDTEYTVLTGVKAQRDSKGHIVGLTYTAQKIKDTNSDTDTHYTTGIRAGANGTNANSETTNPYIKVLDNTTYRSQIQLNGDGTTTVKSDANGKVTISSADAYKGTVTSITPGTGLTGTSSDVAITTSGTINLKTAGTSEIGGIKVGKVSTSSAQCESDGDTLYNVNVDKNGKAYVALPQFVITDTNYYPTKFSWTAGTTAGPTGSLTGSGMTAVSFGAIPSASSSASGIVTTGAQTFKGIKTFSSGLIVNSGIEGNPYSILLESNNTHSYKIEAYDTTSENDDGMGLYIGTDRGLDIVGGGGLAINVGSDGGGYGSYGQVLKSNGSSVYWGTDNSGSASYSAGTGISISSNTISTKLRSTTALTVDSSAATTTNGRVYPVAPDKSGYLSVNVPWSDTNTKVTQDQTTTNGSFPLLLKYTNNTTKETNTAKYGANLTYNPSTTTLKFGANGTISNNSGVTIKNDNTSLTSASYIKLETSGNNAQIDLDAPLVSAQGNLNINGNLSFTGYIPSMVFFGYCSSGANVAEKEITVDNGFPSSDIPVGTLLIVYFSNSNSVRPEFYINGEGAYSVIYGITNNYTWAANSCIPFVFTGSEFRVVGKLS